MSNRIRLVWHRRDLRLHDNFLYSNLGNLQQNVYNDDGDNDSPAVVSLYIFDDKDFARRPSTCRPNQWDTVNMGPHATRILLESVHDLRKSLQEKNSNLIVRRGNPSEIIPQIMQEIGATEIYWNEEPGAYEQEQSLSVWKALKQWFPQRNQIQMCTSLQYTLYHPDDLPMGEIEWDQLAQPNRTRSKKKKNKEKQKQDDSSQSRKRSSSPWKQDSGMVDIGFVRWDGMSKIMGEFRKAARAKNKPRKCIPTPAKLNLPVSIRQSLEPGDIPNLKELCRPLLESTNDGRPILGQSVSTIQTIVEKAIEAEQIEFDSSGSDKRAFVRGGETVALEHLVDFIQNHAASAQRNVACVDDHQSARISHSLAFGCLSPRKVIEQVEDHGDTEGNCNWVISHMTMRDFFLYTCIASGSKFYSRDGIPVRKATNGESIQWKHFDTNHQAETDMESWSIGTTGLPLVDAAMKEMMETGYCSNRVRQNAASVLTKDLQLDWRAGAEWFQFLLQDHCVGANWGNWLYFSGVGPDPKQRHFRTVSQALKYDADGKYVKQWIPELKDLTANESYLRPWDFKEDWKTIVDPETQYTWGDLKRLQESGTLIACDGQTGT